MKPTKFEEFRNAGIMAISYGNGEGLRLMAESASGDPVYMDVPSNDPHKLQKLQDRFLEMWVSIALESKTTAQIDDVISLYTGSSVSMTSTKIWDTVAPAYLISQRGVSGALRTLPMKERLEAVSGALRGYRSRVNLKERSNLPDGFIFDGCVKGYERYRAPTLEGSATSLELAYDRRTAMTLWARQAPHETFPDTGKDMALITVVKDGTIVSRHIWEGDLKNECHGRIPDDLADKVYEVMGMDMGNKVGMKG